VRDPAKLKFDYQARGGIHLLEGDLREIEQYGDLLPTIDVAILAATSWGGVEETNQINVVKTLALMSLLNPQKCEQVIYFSTASILNQQNELLPEAGEFGTTYISTKYKCCQRLPELEIYPKITTVFPTLVIGGDENKPYSHLYAGLPEVLEWIGLIRWFKADGSFHFIHGRDIAQVVSYLIEHPEHTERKIVLGNQQITVDRAVEEISSYLGKKIYFRIPLSIGLANFFIKLFRMRVQEWDQFSLRYRHFTYKKVFNPSSFGLSTYCPTLAEVLRLRGIKAT
jgi:nucleoside-diphosphate-sugar epimerase